jgi:hypothetical protein
VRTSFLVALRNDGIPLNDERATVNEGHFICANVKPPTSDGSVSPDAVTLLNNVMSTLHVDWEQATSVIVDAGNAYCPGRVG